ncbi:MAG: response regulator transcription factor [Candidatus Rokubacteria bacterium]|nr:response regulator transcription factor [Candidatus Rokubacteria bacterium]
MERDVIRLITKGRTNPQIAQELRDKVATGGYTRSPIPGHQDA